MQTFLGKKVLVVDDDPSILRLLSRTLESAGYSVRQAVDGIQALAAVDDDCPDFLITDWDMPQLSGLELCRRLRKVALPHYVYLMILTAKTSSGASIAGLEAGADDFLTKPVGREELLARLHAGRRVLELERRLLHQARNDPLTDIPTRRAFQEALEKEFTRGRRYRIPLSCVMIDVDFFKRVNDEHGHQVGDVILKVVAGVLADTCRTSDFICRYGGEEFCALLPETSEIQAVCWAERLRASIASLAIPVDGQVLNVTASLGVGQAMEDMATADELVDHADQALLVAKQSGRNRVVCFGTVHEDSRFKMAWTGSDPFKNVSARDIMSTPVACMHKDETIGHSADFFCRFRVTSAPVVDDEGKLVGIVSEKDVIGVMPTPGAWQKPISEVMRSNVVCYDEDTPAEKIYDFLSRVAIRRVVIVNRGWPTGVIGRSNLLRWFSNWLRNTSGSPRLAARIDGDAAARTARERINLVATNLASEACDLRSRLCDRPDQAEHLVVGGASRMQELIDDLLSFAREAGAASVADAASIGASNAG